MARRLSLSAERRQWEHFVETGEVDPRIGRNKFNAQQKAANGRVYHSTGEQERAIELQWLLKIGEISNLRYQVRYEIIPRQPGERPVSYTADFVYNDKHGNLIVEDVKGHRTAEYRMKRKLMLLVHGIHLLETQVAKKQKTQNKRRPKRWR